MTYRFKQVGARVEHKALGITGLVYDFRFTQGMHRVFVIAERNGQNIVKFDCTEDHLEEID